MDSQRHRIETPVGELAVRTLGSPQAPAAVLWHSLFVDGRSWDRLTPHLAGDRRLVSITGPGHGYSTDPGAPYTLSDCAAAATTVLEAMQISEPVDWVGNAWGGHVGIVFAETRPERCRTLVTIGTPVHAYPPASARKVRALLAAYRLTGATGFLQDAVAGALLSADTRRTDPSAVSLVRGSFAIADRTRMANAISSISLHRPDLTPLLPQIATPALFITGTEHPDWSPQQAQDAAGLLPHGAATAVEGAAYLVPMERPREVAGLIQDFWAKHPASQ